MSEPHKPYEAYDAPRILAFAKLSKKAKSLFVHLGAYYLGLFYPGNEEAGALASRVPTLRKDADFTQWYKEFLAFIPYGIKVKSTGSYLYNQPSPADLESLVRIMDPLYAKVPSSQDPTADQTKDLETALQDALNSLGIDETLLEHIMKDAPQGAEFLTELGIN